ncbi:hypothetical protein HN385_02855 [archaeon]|jgi:hypothetical protein|nr:hypothetical protein [archaeon]MBT3450566.1 hypothetical protein [archaeon]MBT6868420.1 hypothetical protein [archaeon]MBT7193519.1 hypothetical protein [archaeon]MBT7381286.1 hypothetical protein [archaeon]
MVKRKAKKRMTDEQEFEIMKLVLDKFLWLGFIVMGWGMFQTLSTGLLTEGIWYLIAGAILLIIFMIMIIKEYQIWK